MKSYQLVYGTLLSWLLSSAMSDAWAGATTRVSVDSTGAQGNSNSLDATISADGRYVAFSSYARNLVINDTNRVRDVFVHDRQTGETSRVSVDSNGAQSNCRSSRPSLSADGRYVAFLSDASNLVADDSNNSTDVFVHDRQTGETTRVSDVPGVPGSFRCGQDVAKLSDPSFLDEGYAFSPKLSADGRYIAFAYRGIFVYDQQTRETTRLSVESSGALPNNGSAAAVISADGRYVAFESSASDRGGIFVHDRQTGETSRVSVGSDGIGGSAAGLMPTISADGR